MYETYVVVSVPENSQYKLLRKCDPAPPTRDLLQTYPVLKICVCGVDGWMFAPTL